jgi:hypothetical protein
MSKHLLLVLTNPVDGREDEFNDWYTNRHLDDVLKIPGIVAAQRFALSPVQRMSPPLPWTYFAIYEIETDDLAATVDALTSRSGTALMPISDAMQAQRQAFVVQPITERRIGDGRAPIDR